MRFSYTTEIDFSLKKLPEHFENYKRSGMECSSRASAMQIDNRNRSRLNFEAPRTSGFGHQKLITANAIK